jgi:uncharacterized protein (DUF305 family)
MVDTDVLWRGWLMILRGVVCWCTAVVAMVGLAACTEEPPESANQAPVILPGGPGEPAKTIPPGEATPIPQAPPNDADFEFMRRMIVHHQQAILMTGLVPERASADNVKKIASRIGDSQKPEIAAMNGWLHEHGQPTIDPAEHGQHSSPAGMPGMATNAQLDELRAARGTDFDTRFLRLMIAHHEGALTMARAVQTSGRDVRVQELADEVIAIQSDEISNMRAMDR